ncbi:MAG TPA: PAS domain S-box protein [Gemmataceae bacterium]|nr:PAS domain S-box protein [Gemmataceae bacterium]
MTADISDGARRRALAAGAKDFLTKPVDAIEVLLRIQNLLETRFLYQELQQSADRRIREQAALLDRANDAILVEDLEHRIEYWNEGATKLYGWTAAEAIGRNALQLLFEGPALDRREASERSLKEGNWEGELHQVRRDRRPLTVAPPLDSGLRRSRSAKIAADHQYRHHPKEGTRGAVGSGPAHGGGRCTGWRRGPRLQ